MAVDAEYNIPSLKNATFEQLEILRSKLSFIFFNHLCVTLEFLVMLASLRSITESINSLASLLAYLDELFFGDLGLGLLGLFDGLRLGLRLDI
jgi:hypothetical protein